MNDILQDPRRRNLAILGAAALIAMALAIGAIWQQSTLGEAAYEPTQFLPGFAKELRNAAHIRVTSKAGTFDVVFKPEKGWVVPQRGDFPASFDLVQRTLVGLAALQAIEPKTSRPEWFGRLGLETPPQGDGVLISVGNDKGTELASLIAGRAVDIGDPSGAVGLFVRHKGENQAWLARSVFEARPAIADWLDKTVMNLDISRVQEVSVEPQGGTPFTVARAKPDVPDFTVAPLPAGKTVTDPAAPGGIASASTGFGFDDVRPAREIDFTAATHVTTKTFDGLKVTVNVVHIGQDYWATLSAESVNADAAKEAAEINAHASGWAYKLPSFKGQLYMTTLDSLLKAPATPPAPAP